MSRDLSPSRLESREEVQSDFLKVSQAGGAPFGSLCFLSSSDWDDQREAFDWSFWLFFCWCFGGLPSVVFLKREDLWSRNVELKMRC